MRRLSGDYFTDLAVDHFLADAGKTGVLAQWLPLLAQAVTR